MIKVGQTTTNQTIALPYELNNEGDTSILLNELKGNTTQNGTPTPTSPVQVNAVKGKNYANIYEIPSLSVTAFKREVANDQIKIYDNTNSSGYMTTERTLKQVCPNLQVGDVVTLSFETTFATKYIYLSGYNQVWNNGASKTLTQQMLDSTIIMYGGYNQTTIISKFMIRKSTDNANYLPYNTIEVEIVGKNLAGGKGINAYIDANGVVQTNSYNRLTDIIYVKPNTQYTISTNTIMNSIQCAFFDTNNSLISRSQSNNVQTKTITTPNNCWYLRAWINYNGSTSGSTIMDENSFTTYQLQIEKGTATPYEAHKSNNYPLTLGDIELCKIGTYQDRIYKQNDKWYLEKQVGKVVLNGTETYSAHDTYGLKLFRTNPPIIDNVILGKQCYSNYYNGIEVTEQDMVSKRKNGDIYINPTNPYIDIVNNDISNASDFRTWLSTHNTIVYYALATPTTTEITDETLLEQLDAIGELYRGTNNIMITDTIAPVENIIIEKSNAEFDLVPYIKREPKLDYIDRKGDTGYTADGHYFENIIARKRGLEFELIPMSQEDYLSVISNFIDKTQIPVYIDDLFTGETNLIQTYKKEKIPTKQITENGIVRGTTIKLEEI